ncbi:hypothetical protein C1H46_011666 [Malus baccata]|uniref:Uncharacterized protein n=1 Tax=Malus baccata TaxID=106549 RepID=A0A540MWQ1_MALBA|nr:hypothetical protein C1H46_011666 [Malus baccata]
MVCPLGNGRMAVMARLLAGVNVSQSITEGVGHHKFAAQIICRELSEANEANLLDEEDMHVFGLKPMDDRLHLEPYDFLDTVTNMEYDFVVSRNVGLVDGRGLPSTVLYWTEKLRHFSQVCCNACKKPVKASQYAAHAGLEETTLELDGSMGQRKPLRKERKKSSTAHAMNSAHADATYMMDCSGVSPGNTNGSTSVTLPPTKRFKMIPGHQLPLSDDIGTASAVSKLASAEDAYPYRDSPKGAISALKYKKSGQALDCCLPIKDCPLPLATKVYYSQRGNRLRSDLSHLYHETMASTEELCSDMRDSQPLPSLRKPDQILAQNSEVCLENSIGCLPDGDFSNQFPVDNDPRPQVAGVGLARSKILSKPYSFAGNSGILESFDNHWGPCNRKLAAFPLYRSPGRNFCLG